MKMVRVVDKEVVIANTTKYDEVIFDTYNYDADNEKDDIITNYADLQLESRKIYYSKIFNILKYYRA